MGDEAAAGSGRSKHWKRSNPPLAHSAKAHSPSSFPARVGPIPRSPQAFAYESNPPYYVGVASDGSVPHMTHIWDRPQDRPRDTSGASWVRSEHWNVHTLIPLARSARKPDLCPRSLRAQDRTRGAPHQRRQAERDRARASVGTSTPYNSPRAAARKLHLSQRSLRAQARSRGAPRHTHRAPAFVEVAVFMIALPLLCKNAGYSIGPVG